MRFFFAIIAALDLQVAIQKVAKKIETADNRAAGTVGSHSEL